MTLPDPILPIYSHYTSLFPGASMADFADWVMMTTGIKVSDVLSYEDAEVLIEQLGIDPEMAEALWEGMDSGP